MSPPLWLLVAACSAPSLGPTPEAAPPVARVDALVLTASDVSTGKPVHLRITGAVNTTVAIVSGAPGGPTCPPGFQGACFDLASVKLIATVKADAAGLAIVDTLVPPKSLKQPLVGFQAMVVDPAGVRVSNLVERKPIKPAVWTDPTGHNVLVVLLDDVGVDRMATYGAKIPAQTPVIDSLAAEGMVFEQAWSMPLCGPTRATIQTGLMPRRTGYGKNGSAESPMTELDPAFTTIAEVVDHSPNFVYSSSYLGKWHLTSGFSPSGVLGPKVQGWDYWTGTVNAVDHWFGPRDGQTPDYDHVQLVDDAGDLVVSNEYATTRTINDAIGRLGVMTEPWLLQVALNASHEPFHEPPAGLYLTPLGPNPTNADLHRAATEAADTEIGRLLAAIPADVRERTMIFVLADNGTPGPAADPNEDPDRTKASLYDGGVRVPFIATGPLVTAPGSRTDALVHVADLFPTIAEIVGVHVGDLPNAADPAVPLSVDGLSLFPVLADPKTDLRVTNFAEKFAPGGGGSFSTDQRTARNKRFKLIHLADCDVEQFFEYKRASWDEGPDLLLLGPLTVEQEEARAELRAEIDARWASLAYEADTWPVVAAVPDCDGAGDTSDTGNVVDTNAPGDTSDTSDPD